MEGAKIPGAPIALTNIAGTIHKILYYTTTI
jgi:hypothetical protein